MSRVQELTVDRVSLKGGALLEKGAVYLIPLQERLHLPATLSAKANPKSSTGRIDVFTRLITDFADEFDAVRSGYRGGLFAEVVPRTFSVYAENGTTLNQLRIYRGTPRPSDAQLQRLNDAERIVFQDSSEVSPDIAGGLWLGVDLGATEGDLIGYRALRSSPPIDLRRIGSHDPRLYWEPVRRGRAAELILQPDEFYILASRQRIRIPTGFAADMVPYDPSVGEFRVHYAGFFDPGFGYSQSNSTGTPAVLEVRSHEMPFVMSHAQMVGRLIYERLLAPTTRAYGAAIGSRYNGQGLTLSKYFAAPDWT